MFNSGFQYLRWTPIDECASGQTYDDSFMGFFIVLIT